MIFKKKRKQKEPVQKDDDDWENLSKRKIEYLRSGEWMKSDGKKNPKSD